MSDLDLCLTFVVYPWPFSLSQFPRPRPRPRCHDHSQPEEIAGASASTGLSAEEVGSYARERRVLSLEKKKLDKFKEVRARVWEGVRSASVGGIVDRFGHTYLSGGRGGAWSSKHP